MSRDEHRGARPRMRAPPALSASAAPRKGSRDSVSLPAAPYHQQQRCPRAPRSAMRKEAPPASPSTDTTRPAGASSPPTTRGETHRLCARGTLATGSGPPKRLTYRKSQTGRGAHARMNEWILWKNKEMINTIKCEMNSRERSVYVCVCICYSWVCVSAPVCGQRSGPIWWLLCCFTLQCACISRFFCWIDCFLYLIFVWLRFVVVFTV